MGSSPGRACRGGGYSQAVDHGASFPTLPLPLVHLREQVEERLLGVGNVAVRRPAQELELAHHQLALLELDVGKKEGKKLKKKKHRKTISYIVPPAAAAPGSRPCFSAAALPAGDERRRDVCPSVSIAPLRTS